MYFKKLKGAVCVTPFEKIPLKSSSKQPDGDNGTVDYWYFNSADGDNNLRMTYDEERKTGNITFPEG